MGRAVFAGVLFITTVAMSIDDYVLRRALTVPESCPALACSCNCQEGTTAMTPTVWFVGYENNPKVACSAGLVTAGDGLIWRVSNLQCQTEMNP